MFASQQIYLLRIFRPIRHISASILGLDLQPHLGLPLQHKALQKVLTGSQPRGNSSHRRMRGGITAKKCYAVHHILLKVIEPFWP
jgi:hypothetical protein